MKKLSIVVGVVAALTLTACGSADPPAAAPAPTVTVTATPAPTQPEPRGPHSPIEAIDAYVMCLPWATTYSASPGEVDVASFDDPRTVVTVRSDGNWFVYVHFYNNREGYNGREMAVGCALKGTMGDVEWTTANTGDWQDPTTFEPDEYEEVFPMG